MVGICHGSGGKETHPLHPGCSWDPHQSLSATGAYRGDTATKFRLLIPRTRKRKILTPKAWPQPHRCFWPTRHGKNDRNHLQGQRIEAASSASQPSWPCCKENPAHLASPGQCPPGTDSADQAKKELTALGLGTSCRQQNLPCPTDTHGGLAMEAAA